MKNNKAMSALLAIVIAFGLWLYVITVEKPESDKTFHNIPVVLQNEDLLAERNLMLVSGAEPVATVKLMGSRTNLNNINGANLTLAADLSSIREAGEYALNYSVITPSNVPNNAVSVVEKNPEQVIVTVAKRAEKYVPVQVDWDGAAPEGYLIDKTNAVLDPAQVWVSGPKDVVDRIDHAVITVDCQDRTESFAANYTYTLVDRTGEPLDVKLVETNTVEVRLQVRISQTKVLPLKLKVTSGGGATERNSEIKIDPLSITVTGSETALEELDELIIGSINLAEIAEDTTLKYEIELPEGVRNESGIHTATVTIAFPELEKRTLEIHEIKMINVPQGMVGEVGTKALSITVRGPAEQVQALEESDITVSVDMKEVNGTETVIPTITFGEEFRDVGAVGKYSVIVTLTEAPEPTEGG